jgi:AcrR family transcriptional regulator
MAIQSTRKLIQAGGLKGVTIRKIADDIGYTSGTLYQLFKNLDALLMEVHIETLRDLRLSLETIDLAGAPEDALLRIARGYTEFSTRERNLWNALFEHDWPNGVMVSSPHEAEVVALIGLAAQCIGPLLPKASDEEIFHEARTLWACLYGIVSLETAGKLSKVDNADAILVTLVANYLAGLKVRQTGAGA